MGRPQPIKDQSIYYIPLSQQSLSEDVIIDLHKIFLTNGIHHIKVSNQAYGRQLVGNLLQSLNYYHDVGFLTLDGIEENELYHDVYALFHECGYLEENGNHDFDLFFQEAFFFDFMIIEVTNRLKSMQWFAELMGSMEHLAFDTKLPIILISF